MFANNFYKGTLSDARRPRDADAVSAPGLVNNFFQQRFREQLIIISPAFYQCYCLTKHNSVAA
jgi:hypothetical protein